MFLSTHNALFTFSLVLLVFCQKMTYSGIFPVLDKRVIEAGEFLCYSAEMWGTHLSPHHLKSRPTQAIVFELRPQLHYFCRLKWEGL